MKKLEILVLKIGGKISNKEKEERKLFDKNQLIAGLKEVTALFGGSRWDMDKLYKEKIEKKDQKK